MVRSFQAKLFRKVFRKFFGIFNSFYLSKSIFKVFEPSWGTVQISHDGFFD